jgi:hypothetical protein
VPPLPAGGELLWQTFIDMHGARQAGLGGPLPITWADILAWGQVHGVQLSPWEAGVIKQIDQAALAAMQPDEVTKP